MAAGEVFLPVLSGTLTTIAPFFPLLFWKSVMGKFMFFLPVTLIITLMASLVIAYIINPVFAVRFMKAPYTLALMLRGRLLTKNGDCCFQRKHNDVTA
jgi:multidrug efflux pump subunit AcrB